MSIYLGFAVLVAHIALGAIQSEKDPSYFWALSGGVALVCGLHLATGLMSFKPDHKADESGWLKVGVASDLIDARAKIVRPKEAEAIAVFRHGDKVFAISNVCRHQGGPLGEGRIVDECVTCPWHGFQYRMEDGRSPAPFTEKIATYATEIRDGVVYVNPKANPPGTAQAPSLIGARIVANTDKKDAKA